jgi:hypothetical protein
MVPNISVRAFFQAGREIHFTKEVKTAKMDFDCREIGLVYTPSSSKLKFRPA